jgi:DNA polymerase-2
VIKAFLLTRQWIDTPDGIQLELWLNTEKGAYKLVIKNQQTLFFVAQADIPAIEQTLQKRIPHEIKNLQLKTFEDQPVAGIYFRSQSLLYQARDLLKQNNIRCMENDIRPTDRYLAERFITGPVFLHKHENRITPTDYSPDLRTLSLDIETGWDNDRLYSIAFVCENVNRVLMIGNNAHSETVEYHPDETSLIKRFIAWVEKLDPDVFIGWNVVQFDFRFLQQKCDQLRIPFQIGREKSLPAWRQAQDETSHYFLFIPGRVVLDGIDLLKTATWQFNSYSLESVASELLGRGKLIKAEATHDPLYKAKEITRLFHHDKPALAAYNLEDCQLVSEIFEHADLIHFAIERARLTGLELDRSGGSVAAFENLYLPRLHRKGYVAPNIGDNQDTLTAPGGYVMDSQPGLYDSVLVLDYKSLYPSIIRTFKIDPYGMLAAQTQNAEDIIPGFNGASFSKSQNILPDIIAQLWQARDEAKAQKNKALSQAIKIIMNSFYGVLGTPGCRVHDAKLTSSITLRGHEVIKQTVRLIEQQGYPVIYGDTDSVFVSLQSLHTNAQADAIGHKLVSLINDYWKQHLLETYNTECFMEVQYETHYQRFFMPTARGSDKGSKKRYAGLIIDHNDHETIKFKGLENVRSDWTELARNFQQELYAKIFRHQPYEEYIAQTVQDLKSGQYDAQLIYRKRLRQKLTDYTRNIPPHVQAALKAEKIFAEKGLPSRYHNRGWIEYYITVNGPETIECKQSALDYQHYIDKQLTPIADSILSVLGKSMEPIFQDQIELF